MTLIRTRIAALTAAVAALAAGTALYAGGAGASSEALPRPALVIDAAAARDGRELVDPRLIDVDADVRLPRTAAEARTNVRYFAELGRRIVVVGPRATAAAGATGVSAASAGDLASALSVLGR
jgi:hypothetical protein